jgi:hypothetical protein
MAALSVGKEMSYNARAVDHIGAPRGTPSRRTDLIAEADAAMAAEEIVAPAGRPAMECHGSHAAQRKLAIDSCQCSRCVLTSRDSSIASVA